jgi:hypothetical protein
LERGEGHTGFWYGNLKEKSSERPRYRRKCNIKMGLQDVGWRIMDWVDQVQDRDR